MHQHLLDQACNPAGYVPCVTTNHLSVTIPYSAPNTLVDTGSNITFTLIVLGVIVLGIGAWALAIGLHTFLSWRHGK